jgi:hypothetical protein
LKRSWLDRSFEFNGAVRGEFWRELVQFRLEQILTMRVDKHFMCRPSEIDLRRSATLKKSKKHGNFDEFACGRNSLRRNVPAGNVAAMGNLCATMRHSGLRAGCRRSCVNNHRRARTAAQRKRYGLLAVAEPAG